MKLAMYKGPPDDLIHWIGHAGVCLRTWSRYSHCEAVFGELDATGHATCWSASNRDGGVRKKRIKLDSGHWDVFDLPWADELDEAVAENWFIAHEGAGYDWLGNAGFVLPWRTEDREKFFCSEAVAAAFGFAKPWTRHPADLLRRATTGALKLHIV